MTEKILTVEVIPSARRLIHSLRDIGYDFKHAVADLVDNSITAGATIIDITMRFSGKESYVRIVDNGSGMDATTLTEAMRFGTERDYKATELGKFGLGLKTASLSQCSLLTVASRNNRAMQHIEVRQWDLTHVIKTNRWEIIDIPDEKRPNLLVEPLHDKTGTVIIWSLLDRVLEYKDTDGDRAQTNYLRLADELDQHLSMVFHRFLAGEARRRKKIKITINETTIEAWDPFAREEDATIEFPAKEIEVNGDNGPGIVTCTPYLLPARDQFSSLKAFNRYSGPNKWNYQQGFYIYRADRMIQSGGWSYMRASDEHTKFARIALEFWPELDSAFDLNVAKAKVNLPAGLKIQLKPLVEKLAKQARDAYSASSKKNIKHGSGESKNSPQSLGNESRTGQDTYPVHFHIGQALEKAAAKAGESFALRHIKKVLKIQFPETAKEIGW